MKTRGPVPRRFWGLPHLMVLLSLFLAACAPSQPAAPKAETKPTEVAKTAPAPAPAASPAAAPAAKPAESPAAAAPAKPAASPVAAPAAAPAASPAAAPAAPAASPAAAAKPAAKPISLPAPEKPAIKMAHATLETSQLAYAVAALNGLYKKYGLDVELLFTEGDGKTLQTLVAGGADVSTQGISTALSSQVTDVPLAVISMTATTLTDAIVSSPDVKTKEDLRGKSVAISTFGSTAHAAAVLALQSMGMTPNDVNIVQVGGQASRIAALKGGSVAGAVVDVAQEDEMKAQGFNILTRLPDTPLEFGRNGLLVRRDWLSQYPNTLLALTAGTLEGQNMIWNDTPKAVESFMKWAQITDRARAESEIEFFKRYGNRDMRWTKEGWERARDILAFSNPEVKDVDVEKAYTFQFLDRVREAGLNDQLGIPARR